MSDAINVRESAAQVLSDDQCGAVTGGIDLMKLIDTMGEVASRIVPAFSPSMMRSLAPTNNG